jgi:hypothetical protein
MGGVARGCMCCCPPFVKYGCDKRVRGRERCVFYVSFGSLLSGRWTPKAFRCETSGGRRVPRLEYRKEAADPFPRCLVTERLQDGSQLLYSSAARGFK